MRQSQTAVYNVHPEVFDEVLAGVLDTAGLSWSRAGNRYFIARANKGQPPAGETPKGVAEPAAPPAPERRVAYPASAEDVERSAYLEAEPVPTLCHVTLRWETEDAELRKQVEGELERALAEVRTSDNPTASWLLTAGTVLLLSSAMVFVAVVLYRLFALKTSPKAPARGAPSLALRACVGPLAVASGLCGSARWRFGLVSLRLRVRDQAPSAPAPGTR